MIAAGVSWPVSFSKAAVSALPASAGTELGLPVIGGQPGRADRQRRAADRGRAVQPVPPGPGRRTWPCSAPTAAPQLGISSLANEPAIFIGGQPFTVVGILASDARLPQLNLGVTVPESTALSLWGKPKSSGVAQMLIHTRLGAAQVVAAQVPIALQPGNPKLLSASAPANPTGLRHSVTASLNSRVPGPGRDRAVHRRGGHREHHAGGGAGAVGRDRAAPGAGRPAAAHRHPVPGRVDGAGTVRRPGRRLRWA